MKGFNAVRWFLCFIAALVILFTGLATGKAEAAWSTNPTLNNAVSIAAGSQQNPVMTSDGSGGAISAWTDDRGGTFDIYAQRINASGVVQWLADGVAITTLGGSDQSNPTITSDGSGGAIITWIDNRNGNYDIYAQRINAAGAVQWLADGVAICNAGFDQLSPTIISDGSGGAIITWQDARGAALDIYTQRVNAAGAVQWLANGVAISTAVGNQAVPVIISDGSGGAIITWQDFRSGTDDDIYAQRINAAGAVQWLANGVAISTAAFTQGAPTIISDGSGGAIITWNDQRSGANYDIYAQRINAAGAVQWLADGVLISNAALDQRYPTIISDGGAGAIITWQDLRSGGANYDIYAQRINAAGAVQWLANGVAISTAANGQLYPVIISDGGTGAIITWNDIRSGNNDVYAQRIDANGALTDPVVIAAASVSVPTMNEWGMMIFMLLAGLGSMYYMRRRV